jgi:hypothetical protein
MRVGQRNLKARLFQSQAQRNPVNAGRLHNYPFAPACFEPLLKLSMPFRNSQSVFTLSIRAEDGCHGQIAVHIYTTDSFKFTHFCSPPCFEGLEGIVSAFYYPSSGLIHLIARRSANKFNPRGFKNTDK